jgi:hypothetical protein
LATVGTPPHATIRENAHNFAVRRTAKRFDAVSSFEVGGLTKTLDDFNHRLTIQHPSDVMSDGGHNLTAAASGQFRKDCSHKLAANIRESIAVEEKERRAPMALAKKIYGLGEGEAF